MFSSMYRLGFGATSRKVIGAMIILISAATAITGCLNKSEQQQSQIKVAGKSPGQLRGFAQINQFYKERISSTGFSILNRVLYGSTDNIEKLLGAFDGSGENNRFYNDIANATNMFIWRAIFTKTSDRLAQNVNSATQCKLSGHDSDLKSDFLKIVSQYCNSPTEANLQALWTYWLGVEYTDNFANWYKDFAKVKSPSGASEDDFFIIYYSMFMNPYFLFET